MRRLALWLILISFLALGGIVYFFLLQKEGGIIFEQNSPTSDTFDTQSIDNSFQTPTSQTPLPTTFVEILPADCTNECTTFQASPDQYVYCQNVCGLSPDPSASTPKLTDPKLSQDIDKKEAAIKEGNLSGCDTITDSTLRKTCQVRVTEDLLE